MAVNDSPVATSPSGSEPPVVDHQMERPKYAELGSFVDPNFVINRDSCTLTERQHFVMADRSPTGCVNQLESRFKLSLSYYQARLYGRIKVTAKRSLDDDSWMAFKRELEFVSRECCHWHNHPNILQYHGLVFYKDEKIPFLLSERVDRNLLSLLDVETEWSQKGKVSVVYDIACGLSFLHSRKPHPIVHGALGEASVLINDEKKVAKICNFFHAGCEGEALKLVISKHFLNPKYETLCSQEGVTVKLRRSLDMMSLGCIVKTIDVQHARRAPMSTNILQELYALYDNFDYQNAEQPSKFSADEVCQKLYGYLVNQQGGQRNRTEQQQHGPPQSVMSLHVI